MTRKVCKTCIKHSLWCGFLSKRNFLTPATPDTAHIFMLLPSYSFVREDIFSYWSMFMTRRLPVPSIILRQISMWACMTTRQLWSLWFLDFMGKQYQSHIFTLCDYLG